MQNKNKLFVYQGCWRCAVGDTLGLVCPYSQSSFGVLYFLEARPADCSSVHVDCDKHAEEISDRGELLPREPAAPLVCKGVVDGGDDEIDHMRHFEYQVTGGRGHTQSGHTAFLLTSLAEPSFSPKQLIID
ncbi:hypothetical protein T06_16323 [Trichinella sp. T6]|nr:hypothetical protein T06_16323 [Trichinella sp. T6]